MTRHLDPRTRRDFRPLRTASLFAACVLLPSLASAEDAYYVIPVDELTLTEGELPDLDQTSRFRAERELTRATPHAVLDSEGEIYLGRSVGGFDRWNRQAGGDNVFVIAPEGKAVTGTLFLPEEKNQRDLRPIRFRIEPDESEAGDKAEVLTRKQSHYETLIQSNHPGAAWFRYRALQAQATRQGKKLDEALTLGDENRNPRRNRNRSDWDDTFQMLSGGRAVSENLQLDRLLPSSDPSEVPSVDISTLEGITISEMDWDAYLKDAPQPKTDELAVAIPFDQHALFFPTFQAMIDVMDEAEQQGTPLLQLVQTRAESANTKEFYQRQMCLEVSLIARTLGPKLIDAVALTGSDPYLRTGTDVAVLFASQNPTAVESFLLSKQSEAEQRPGVRVTTGEESGVKFRMIRSADRSTSSILATIGDVVVVTNSLAQLKNLAAVADGSTEPLSSLPEYHFFRSRYPAGADQESAFLVITDATIRRWCSAKWRIGASRRTRAAAVLAQTEARLLDESVSVAAGETKPVQTVLYVPDLAPLQLTDEGVHSKTYNTLAHLTPISELDLAKVTKQEARSYEQWRRGYQAYWTRFFDPIALRLSLTGGSLMADLTVMPLIDRSDYNEWIDLTEGAQLNKTSGDPHPEAMLHWTGSLNPNSDQMRSFRRFFTSSLPGINADPIDWMGGDISFYLDKTPFWAELAQAENRDQFLQQNLSKVPFGFRIGVKNPLKLTLFLTGLRGFINGAAPDLIKWETREHEGRKYVYLKPQNIGLIPDDDFAIVYAATSEQFLVSFNEGVIQRALQREEARKNGTYEHVRPTPIGENLLAEIQPEAVTLMGGVFGDAYRTEMQRRCYRNIPILNEMRTLRPDADPVALYEEIFESRLLCPGGGEYVWNEADQTMSSTVYGHPGGPKPGPEAIPALQRFRSLTFGLTFEEDGLRTRANLQRADR